MVLLLRKQEQRVIIGDAIVKDATSFGQPQ
jgi:hypothetical protein